MPIIRLNKSSRKLQHRAKNLEDVLVLPASSTSFFSGGGSKTPSKNNVTSERHGSSSDSYTEVSDMSNIRSRRQRKTGLPLYTTKTEDSLDSISFHLGPIEYVMSDNGTWTISLRAEDTDLQKTVQKLTETNTKVDQENNMLRVKNELLADMIAKKTIRKRRLQKDLERLRTLLSTSSSRFTE